ncbi:MAG: TolB family protein, partial [Bacteroidota bacterium]
KCIRECEFAKRKLQKPADVKVYNLGEAVNSRFEEYAPSISSKANLLVFTSRRENTTSPNDRKGKHIFEEGDYKFYEDIYVSKLDSLSNWEDCTNKLGDINTTENDGVLSISPDNSGVFVYKYDLQGGGDIYFSKALPNFKWAKPEALPKNINTSFFEGSTSLTADGNKMYFVSDRLGGLGSCDIYYSEKKGGMWSNPMNLGEIVNTDGDEKFVFIHPNGRTLFFASNGHLGMGSYDIFRTELVNEVWTKPINLGYPINSVNEESTFSLTADNKTMYISAEYTQVSDNGVANYGERDIYKIDISNYPLMAEGYDKLTHGQLICYLKEANSGEAMKGVQIIVESLEDGEITEAFTDKSGMARINLRSQATYKVTAKKGDKIFSEEITLIEKVQNWEIRL